MGYEVVFERDFFGHKYLDKIASSQQFLVWKNQIEIY
jgi:hypothetical protein